jgi:hypothetical protein
VCLWRVYRHRKHLLLESQQRKVLSIAPESLFHWEGIQQFPELGSTLTEMPNLSGEVKKEVHESTVENNLANSIESESIELVDNQSIEDNLSDLTNIEIELTTVNETELDPAQIEDTVTSWNPGIQSKELDVPLTDLHESVQLNETSENEFANLPISDNAEKEGLTENISTHSSTEEPIEATLTASEMDEINSQPKELDEIRETESTSVGTSPDKTFGQWLVWIQERQSVSLYEKVDQGSAIITEPLQSNQDLSVNEEALPLSTDPLEKLYTEHLKAEYFKLDDQPVVSLQQEALERVKKAESGEKNSYNLKQIAKDSLDESLIPVSETLAKVFENQEEWKHAIAVYEKLVLQFPDKTLLFAAKIEELKTKI